MVNTKLNFLLSLQEIESRKSLTRFKYNKSPCCGAQLFVLSGVHEELLLSSVLDAIKRKRYS